MLFTNALPSSMTNSVAITTPPLASQHNTTSHLLIALGTRRHGGVRAEGVNRPGGAGGGVRRWDRTTDAGAIGLSAADAPRRNVSQDHGQAGYRRRADGGHQIGRVHV